MGKVYKKGANSAWTRIIYAILCVVTVAALAIGGFVKPANADTGTGSGYGNRVSLNITSGGTITRDEIVTLTVSVSSDIGTDGNIPVTVSIPKKIVLQGLTSDDITLKNKASDPMSFELTAIDADSDPDNIIVTVTPVRAESELSLNADFEVHFKANGAYLAKPYSYKNLPFTVKYDSSTAQQTRDYTFDPPASYHPLFDKWASCGKIDSLPGVCAMSTTEPTENTFNIPVNYSGDTLKNVVIKDIAPDYTSIVEGAATDKVGGVTASGIRVYKVTFTDAGNVFENATAKFASGITVHGNELTVKMGDIAPTDSYVITYGLHVNDSAGQIQDNVATFTGDINGAHQVIPVRYPAVPINYSGGGVSVMKSVDKSQVLVDPTTNKPQESTLAYTIDFKIYSGAIAAGTEFTDELDPLITAVDFTNVPNSVRVSYDARTHTATFKVVKDIAVGDAASVMYNATLASSIPVGTVISNFVKSDSLSFRSNTVKTTFTAVPQMTLSLKKTDAADGSALEGAQFRLVKLALNADGSVSTKDPTVVAEDLVTNSKGLLKYTAARSAGIYEFQETKAPKGYTLDGALGTASHEVTIEDGDADVTVPVISFTDAKIPVAPPTTTTKTITPPVATTPITPTTPATPSTPKVATPSTPVVTPKTPRTPAPAVPKVTEAVPTPQKSTATPVTPTPKKSTATPQKTAPKTSGSSVAVLATTGSSVDAVAIATVLFIVAGAAATAFRKSGVQKR
ncbi:MAG: hypothetical protein LKJ47_01560 [Bifidobacteriaceae bacterium]|jgi:hypothetical protein|nr:hypothetical protein [Bifidobacteriaceae bacterium]